MPKGNVSLAEERVVYSILRRVSPEDLGRRVRLHRLAMQLSIRQLATVAMVSKTSIVALEQGKKVRPVTLVKICQAMGLHVERLASDEATESVHRRRDDVWLDLNRIVGEAIVQPSDEAQARMRMFQNVPHDAGFITGTIELTGHSGTRSHPGNEFIYVLAGEAEVEVNDQSHLLQVGESLFIPSEAEHSYSPASGSDLPVSLLVFRLG